MSEVKVCVIGSDSLALAARAKLVEAQVTLVSADEIKEPDDVMLYKARPTIKQECYPIGTHKRKHRSKRRRAF